MRVSGADSSPLETFSASPADIVRLLALGFRKENRLLTRLMEPLSSPDSTSDPLRPVSLAAFLGFLMENLFFTRPNSSSSAG